MARVLPMLNGLRTRFPAAEIDWVVQSKAADLLVGHPQIDRLWVVTFVRWSQALTQAARDLRRRMRARRYDLVLDFQGMLKGAVWAVAADASERVGADLRSVRERVRVLEQSAAATLRDLSSAG